MIILLHTSKTMRAAARNNKRRFAAPQLLSYAIELDTFLKTMKVSQLSRAMNISTNLSAKTHALIAGWTVAPNKQNPAIDSFLGDIYSGIQVSEWTKADRLYANTCLRILSGLYGILKPLDGICPYRLEMGYRLIKPYTNLYHFWGETIASTLPKTGPIINLAAVEYSNTVIPFIDSSRVITPIFRTVSPKTGQPTFVTVHAKIARGAFARWLITNRIKNVKDIRSFSDLGYSYRPHLSTPHAPLFVCQEFGGKGLSLRLK